MKTIRRMRFRTKIQKKDAKSPSPDNEDFNLRDIKALDQILQQRIDHVEIYKHFHREKNNKHIPILKEIQKCIPALAKSPITTRRYLNNALDGKIPTVNRATKQIRDTTFNQKTRNKHDRFLSVLSARKEFPDINNKNRQIRSPRQNGTQNLGHISPSPIKLCSPILHTIQTPIAPGNKRTKINSRYNRQETNSYVDPIITESCTKRFKIINSIKQDLNSPTNSANINKTKIEHKYSDFFENLNKTTNENNKEMKTSRGLQNIKLKLGESKNQQYQRECSDAVMMFKSSESISFKL